MLRIDIDSMPAELDLVERKMIQLEVEREALKKEKDEGSKKRLAELEKNLGIPLTSSNHAMAWHALRLAGIDDKLDQFGSLFELALDS